MKLVLDAGALVALERDDRRMWSRVTEAARRKDTLLLPTTALAQVWRGGRRRALVSRALAFFTLATFDALARRVGELCARVGTSDICDAHVALVATLHGDAVYTSDPEDLAVLLEAAGGRRVIVVPC